MVRDPFSTLGQGKFLHLFRMLDQDDTGSFRAMQDLRVLRRIGKAGI